MLSQCTDQISIAPLQILRFKPLLKLDFAMNKGGSTSRSTQTNVDTKTFLLVDNEQAILSCISLLMEARGHQVITAGSAAAATQVMEKQSDEIDCLIIDFSMPDKNGLQLFNQFRSIGWCNPTILCSSQAMSIGDHPDAQYWPEFVLAKPYGLDRLENAISIALGIP